MLNSSRDMWRLLIYTVVLSCLLTLVLTILRWGIFQTHIKEELRQSHKLATSYFRESLKRYAMLLYAPDDEQGSKSYRQLLKGITHANGSNGIIDIIDTRTESNATHQLAIGSTYFFSDKNMWVVPICMAKKPGTELCLLVDYQELTAPLHKLVDDDRYFYNIFSRKLNIIHLSKITPEQYAHYYNQDLEDLEKTLVDEHEAIITEASGYSPFGLPDNLAVYYQAKDFLGNPAKRFLTHSKKYDFFITTGMLKKQILKEFIQESIPIFLAIASFVAILLLVIYQTYASIYALRRQVEEERIRFRLAFDQQFQFMAILSPDGKIIEINNFPYLPGLLNRKMFVGKYFWECDLWHGQRKLQSQIKRNIACVVSEKNAISLRSHYQLLGEVKTAQATYSAVTDARNDVIYVLVQATDITEQEKTLQLLEDNTERLQLALQASSMGVWEWDIKRNEIFWSAETLKIFDLEDNLASHSYEFYINMIPEKWREDINAKILAFMHEQVEDSVLHYEHPITTAAGQSKYIEVIGRLYRGGQGDLERFIGVCRDITQHRESEENLKVLLSAVENASSAILVLNRVGAIEYVNPRFCVMTGYAFQEALGQNFEFIRPENDTLPGWQSLRESMAVGKAWKGEFQNKRKDGHLCWIRAEITAVKEMSGEISHYIAILEDLSNEHHLAERLEYQSEHDMLTGLLNRHSFEHKIFGVLSRPHSKNKPHALCFLDLDQFKIVNDIFGHSVGDEFLRQVSAILLQLANKRTTIARLNGDEFAIFLEEYSLNQAKALAYKIICHIHKHAFGWKGTPHRLSVSIGLVPIHSGDANVAELLKQADSACYMAKELGRNRIHVYSPDDAELLTRRVEMQWVNRIHNAIDHNKFILYAQAIEPLGLDVHLPSAGRHFEILLRMLVGDQLVAPSDFLRAAERFNIIVNVDRWVVENTFKFLKTNDKVFEQIDFISINLSGQSIVEENFIIFVEQLIHHYKLSAHKLCFEITETAAISNLAIAERFVNRLRKLGCRIALDDFGTGVSSFAYLKRLTVDFLKIDGIFVKDMLEDKIDYSMVRSINDIGHIMNIATIAEFVENDAIKEKLRSIKVDYAQGYGVSMPIPLADVKFDDELLLANE